jgi:hypothetical protein
MGGVCYTLFMEEPLKVKGTKYKQRTNYEGTKSYFVPRASYLQLNNWCTFQFNPKSSSLVFLR